MFTLSKNLDSRTNIKSAFLLPPLKAIDFDTLLHSSKEDVLSESLTRAAPSKLNSEAEAAVQIHAAQIVSISRIRCFLIVTAFKLSGALIHIVKVHFIY